MVGFVALLLIQVAAFVLGRLLQPKPKGPDPDFTAPRSEEGYPIPILYGTQEMASNVVACITVRKSKVDQYWRYNARLHHVFCWGVVNELIDLNWDEKSARNWHLTFNASGSLPIWVFPATAVIPGAILNTGVPATQYIDGDQDPKGNVTKAMFGGNQQGGGVEGNIGIYWGHDAQPADSWLSQTFWYGSSKISRWPRVCYIRMGDDDPFYLCANSPQPNPMKVILRRTAWWEATLSPLGQTAAEATINTYDANPAEVIFDLITNTVYGSGKSQSRLDMASFIACAATFKAEGLGISLAIDKNLPAREVIQNIQEHADCVLSLNPITGLLRLKAIRNDYVVASLLRINSSNSSDLEYSPSSSADTKNEIRATYRRFYNDTERRGFVESTIPGIQDNADWESTGSIRTLIQDFPYFTNVDTTTLAAEKLLLARVTPLAKYKGKMNKDGYKLMIGDPAIIEDPARGSVDVIVRIIRINYGSPDKPEVEFEAVQDVFSVTTSIFAPPAGSGFVDPPPEFEPPTDSAGEGFDPEVTWGPVP